MAHFDDIYDIAADGYGIITAAQAREAGAAPSEPNRWCADGRLLRRGHGVYKLARWVPTSYDAYAEAAALVGGGAYLHGAGWPTRNRSRNAETGAANAPLLGGARDRAQG